MVATQAMLQWTFISECPIPNDVNELLVGGEVAMAAYKTIRDSAIFTNKINCKRRSRFNREKG